MYIFIYMYLVTVMDAISYIWCFVSNVDAERVPKQNYIYKQRVSLIVSGVY